MVERDAVNVDAAGSSPASPASGEMVERVARALFLARYPGCEDHWPDRIDYCSSGPPFNADGYREMARAAIAVMAEEFAKIAEAVEVSANGHPQIDAPTPSDMRRAIVAAIRDEALK